MAVIARWRNVVNFEGLDNCALPQYETWCLIGYSACSVCILRNLYLPNRMSIGSKSKAIKKWRENNGYSETCVFFSHVHNLDFSFSFSLSRSLLFSLSQTSSIAQHSLVVHFPFDAIYLYGCQSTHKTRTVCSACMFDCYSPLIFIFWMSGKPVMAKYIANAIHQKRYIDRMDG